MAGDVADHRGVEGKVRSVELIEVVQVVSLTGLGTVESPAREVTEWWRDGVRLALSDPFAMWFCEMHEFEHAWDGVSNGAHCVRRVR